MSISTKKLRLSQFSIIPVEANEIFSHLPVISDIGKSVSLNSKEAQRSFLGCPLSRLELAERFKYSDVYFLLIDGSQCVGYCFGYSAGDSFSQAVEAAKSNEWGEYQLFKHLPQSSLKRSGCIFQVAIRPECHGLGFGRKLVEHATTKALTSLPNGTIFAFVPESPRNTASLNLALRLGYETQEIFPTESHNANIDKWRILRYQRIT